MAGTARAWLREKHDHVKSKPNKKQLWPPTLKIKGAVPGVGVRGRHLVSQSSPPPGRW